MDRKRANFRSHRSTFDNHSYQVETNLYGTINCNSKMAHQNWMLKNIQRASSRKGLFICSRVLISESMFPFRTLRSSRAVKLSFTSPLWECSVIPMHDVSKWDKSWEHTWSKSRRGTCSCLEKTNWNSWKGRNSHIWKCPRSLWRADIWG